MEKHFALINNNLVEAVAVADETFVQLIKSKYSLIIDVTNISRPSPGHSYDPKTHTFTCNHVDYIYVPTDSKQEHLNKGTKSGFDTIQLSKYSASCANGMVTIGCKKFSPISLLDALHKFIIDKQEHVPGWKNSFEGPGYGKFSITWEDARKLHEALVQIKL